MRGNVKTIKITACFSVILAITTYLITIKNYYFAVECKWLPDSFLIATFGGAFASMLVVMICEVSKYYQNRENTETFIFEHLRYLYGRLWTIKKNLEFLKLQDENIPRNAITQVISYAEAEMNAIFFSDYAPLKKNNAFLREKMDYNKTIFPRIQKFLFDCRTLEMAIIKDEIIKSERKRGHNCEVANNKVLVLTKLLEKEKESLTLIDGILTRIDKLCNGKYNWASIRDNMVKSIPDTRTDWVEKFLKD